jgi:hypothetical protein
MYCEAGRSEKKSGMLTYGVVLLHENASPHTATCTRTPLEHFNWELFDYPPHSPDVTPSEYHLFNYLKNWFGKQCFNNNEELMEDVKTWLGSQAADFFDTACKKLLPDTRIATIPAATTYVFYIINFFLFACVV